MAAGADHGLAPDADRAPAALEPRAARRRPRRALPRPRLRPDVPLTETFGGVRGRSAPRAGSAPTASATSTPASSSEALDRRDALRRSRTRTRCWTAATRQRAAAVRGASEVAYLAFSPLAGGWLTGKYRRGEPFPAGSRMTQRPEPLRATASTTGRSTRSSGSRRSRTQRGISMAGARARVAARRRARHPGRHRPGAPGAPEPVREALEHPAERRERAAEIAAASADARAGPRATTTSIARCRRPSAPRRWPRCSPRTPAARRTCRCAR